MAVDREHHSGTAEFAATMTFPEATATTTCTVTTNDHWHEWGRKEATAINVLSLPTTLVLRTTMTAMRTGP